MVSFASTIVVTALLCMGAVLIAVVFIEALRLWKTSRRVSLMQEGASHLQTLISMCAVSPRQARGRQRTQFAAKLYPKLHCRIRGWPDRLPATLGFSPKSRVSDNDTSRLAFGSCPYSRRGPRSPSASPRDPRNRFRSAGTQICAKSRLQPPA
jgi:hypothetical protein